MQPCTPSSNGTRLLPRCARQRGPTALKVQRRKLRPSWRLRVCWAPWSRAYDATFRGVRDRAGFEGSAATLAAERFDGQIKVSFYNLSLYSISQSATRFGRISRRCGPRPLGARLPMGRVYLCAYEWLSAGTGRAKFGAGACFRTI